MLPPPPPDENLQKALQISQHALLIATICLLEDTGLVHYSVLNDSLHPMHAQQRQLVASFMDQLLHFYDREVVLLNADFVRHEIRLLQYKQQTWQSHC